MLKQLADSLFEEGMRSKWKILPILTIILFLLSFTSSDIIAQNGVKNPDKLIYAHLGGIITLDPSFAYDTSSEEVIFNIYENLIMYEGNSTEKFKPMLATSWSISEDGMTYIFNIRKGVRFHNGSRLTPTDVEYTFERAMIQDRDGGPIWMLLEPLLGENSINELAKDTGDYRACQKVLNAVEVDGDSVVFHLDQPYAPFLNILAHGATWASIIDKEWTIEHGGWSGNCSDWRKYHNPSVKESPLYSSVNGTGPFKLVEWEHGDHLTLRRFENYWRRQAKVEEVILKGIESWTTRKLMLEAGNADLISAEPSQASQVESQKGVRITKGLPTLRINAVFFNQEISTTGGNKFIGSGKLDGKGIPPNFFSDIHIRKAFNYAFNWDKYIQEVYLGEARKPHGPIPKDVFGYNPNQSTYHYNLRKAEEEFKKAWGGDVWKEGFQFTITYNTGNESRKTAAKIIAENVRSLTPKFKIETQPLNWSSYLDSMADRKLPMFLIGWIADFPDPHNFIVPFMASYGTFAKWHGYKNYRVDKLIKEGLKIEDQERRKEIYYELQKIAYEDAINIFIDQPTGVHVERDWIHGWYYNPMFPRIYFYPISKSLENQPPNARFIYSPEDPTDLDTINFTDLSTDPDGTITKYKWEFGDGATSNKQNPTHNYTDDGTYVAKLSITDNDGTADSISKTITVSNASPKSEFTFSPKETQVNQEVTFNASQSSDPDGHITHYAWDFGDGSTGSGKVSTYHYKETGTYLVTLTVIDEDKGTDSTSKKITVSEANNPPEAQFSYEPQEPTDLDEIKFTDKSTDPDGNLTTWYWEFGDGSTSNEQNPTHQYQDDGTYQVKLTVTDDQGATDSITKKIEVSNVSPKADFTFSPSKPVIETPVTFNASDSSDPDGTIEEYQWGFGDGSTGKGKKVSHTYTTESTYKVKLTVTDDDGDTGSTQKEIQVTAPPPEIKDKYALIIGISNYKYSSKIPQLTDLKYPKKDAKAFHELLLNKDIGNFQTEKVTLLLNEEATTKRINQAFSKLITKVDESDLVVIYYSGHGAQGPDYNEDEENDNYDEYYVSYDTDLSTQAKLLATGIRDDQFGDWINSLRSKQVAIFLDSCYSGGATKAIKGAKIPGQKAATNNTVFDDFSFEDRLLFSASQENQYSLESDELGHGVFTYYLLKGLEGEADQNQDRQITSTELFNFVRPQVEEFVEQNFSTPQSPLMKGSITIPLIQSKQKLTGIVTSIQNKNNKAGKGDKLLINLGRNQGVKVGDVFEVFHEYQTKAVKIEEVRGRIEVIELVGKERALCEVIESIVPIEVGDRVRKVQQ